MPSLEFLPSYCEKKGNANCYMVPFGEGHGLQQKENLLVRKLLLVYQLKYIKNQFYAARFLGFLYRILWLKLSMYLGSL